MKLVWEGLVSISIVHWNLRFIGERRGGEPRSQVRAATEAGSSGLLKGMPSFLGATHLVVPDRALFAALVRGQTHVLAREYSAALEVPEGHGAGTDPCGQRPAQTGA